jgi:hypothetical protein
VLRQNLTKELDEFLQNREFTQHAFKQTLMVAFVLQSVPPSSIVFLQLFARSLIYPTPMLLRPPQYNRTRDLEERKDRWNKMTRKEQEIVILALHQRDLDLTKTDLIDVWVRLSQGVIVITLLHRGIDGI